LFCKRVKFSVTYIIEEYTLGPTGNSIPSKM